MAFLIKLNIFVMELRMFFLSCWEVVEILDATPQMANKYQKIANKKSAWDQVWPVSLFPGL